MPEESRAGHAKHGMQGVLLADPDLAVTRQLGIVNPHNVSPKGLAAPLPIPTTFLVDAGGVVRWIDQTDDYMLRSAPDRVLGAIREHLDPVAGAPAATGAD